MSSAKPYIIASWERGGKSAFIDDSDFVGGKAYGLFMLPEKWVPPFIVFTREYFDNYAAMPTATDPFSILSHDDLCLIRSLLNNQRGNEEISYSKILIRSNSPTELGLKSRGKFSSRVVGAEFGALEASFFEAILSDRSSTAERLLAIMQICIEPNITGHFSNERRVSPRADRWLVESDNSIIDLPEKIRAGSYAKTDEPLNSKNAAELSAALSRVAALLINSSKQLFHCEWVWNAKRLWIVQADSAHATDSEDRRSIFAVRNIPQPPRQTFQRLQHFLNSDGKQWKKLERPRLFSSLGIPATDIYLLSGASWESSVIEKHLTLRSELARLCKSPVVIRSDILANSPRSDVFLKTSDPLIDPDPLINFMEEAAAEFSREGLLNRDWAFLLANLVPACASAYASAHPQKEIVAVDAIWGFPDGLHYLPHDTYFYDLKSGNLKNHIRYKSNYCTYSDGRWVTLEVGPPYDWKKVLLLEEIRTIAQWAKLISNRLDKEVQLMVLARIKGRRGGAACLPWHYTTFEIPKRAGQPSDENILRRSFIIRNRADVSAYDAAGQATVSKGIIFQPEHALSRDSNFLKSVSKLAMENDATIFFEGSLLGHAYYLMISEGARVVPLQSATIKGTAKKYHKLVRDLIPAVIMQSGSIARIKRIPPHRAHLYLKQKLIEESFELFSAPPGQIIEEMADICEIIEAIRTQNAIPQNKLEQVQQKKRKERGGFDNLVFLEETVYSPFIEEAEQDGMLPLLIDEKPQVFRDRLLSVGGVKMEMGGQLHSEFRIKLPLIPPIKLLQKSARQLYHYGNREIEVTYLDKDILLKIRENVRDGTDLLSQFDLFGDDILGSINNER